MKKKTPAIKTSSSFEERINAFVIGIRQGSQSFFLRRLGILQLFCLVVTALVSVLVVRALLFTEIQEPVEVVSQQEVRLAVPIVEELELWLEERQTAYENPPAIPAQVFSNL